MNHPPRKQEPLVSVIVPVWNVEPYIRQCLDSILAQTYRNLEIILVDDGSPDRCPAICDEYAAMDQRIKVIHQENGGVAKARNTGLRIASGEWIAWVDSDDWVSHGFIEYMLSNVLESGADIAICGRYEEAGRNHRLISPGRKLLNAEDALKELIQDDIIRNYLWDKLWRAKLFEGLAFPNIQAYEDAAVVWKLFDRAKHIVCCPDGYYHYRIRIDGLSNPSKAYPILAYRVKKARYDGLFEKYPQFRRFLEDECRCAALELWSCFYTRFDKEKRLSYRSFYSEVSAFVRQHPADSWFIRNCGHLERPVIKLVPVDTQSSLALASVINRLYRIKNGHYINKWSIPMKPEIRRNAGEGPVIIHPAFAGGTDAIVFCANDYYCPYLSVMLYSVIAHASPDRNYDIITLHRDITPENQETLRKMGAGKDNISIRFLNVSSLIRAYSLYTGGKKEFTIDAYLRLLIPDVLDRAYHKVVYLDSDMLALADVGELLDTELDGYLLASSRDMIGLACYYDPRDKRKNYRDSVLHLSQPNDYFIDGMLVLNLDAFRKSFTSDKLLRLAASRDWLQHDQDVLNLICNEGKAKILHASWDVTKPYRPDLLPEPYRVELEESLKDPKIIHFGGNEKPWRNLDSPWMDLFWDTAAKTPYYKEIIYRNLQHDDPDCKNCEMITRINNGEIRLRHMVKFNAAWVRFKVKSKLYEAIKRKS